jgi:hypothetical protein
LDSQTFKAATITQKSDELESTSALLSLSICCKSGPEMPEFRRRKNLHAYLHETNTEVLTFR